MQVEDRIAGGRAARSAVPRSSHAEWNPGPARQDPVAVLEVQATTRVPDLVPLRHARMLVSPFTFYRGAAAIMAADLAATPTSGIRVQCCGDAHLANFGGYESPERTMVFDINDFDETLPGPWEWDVKRLAASLVIAAQDREFDDDVARQRGCRGAVRAYREAMREFATQGQPRRVVRTTGRRGRHRPVAKPGLECGGEAVPTKAPRRRRRRTVSRRSRNSPSG